GSGVVSLARIFGEIAILGGYEATVIPRYGAERRGAPIYTDIRIAKDGSIKLKSFVTKADFTIVMANKAFSPETIISMTKENGTILFSCEESKKLVQLFQGFKLFFLDLEDKSLEGRDQITLNLRILGAISQIININNETLIIKCIKRHLSNLEEEIVRKSLMLGIQAGADLCVV
ncbi:MAG: 2-oxoacid:acceptor oxidoreductase family protein, partial [Candidatus Hodarchaeales archaeon]